MLAVFNFSPDFCPGCGEAIKASEDRLLSKESFTCACGVSYQVADGQKIIDAAVSSGGDLDTAIRD